MKRMHCLTGLILMLVWTGFLSACGASPSAPSPAAAPSLAPVAATPAASAVAATAAPVPSGTGTPGPDIRVFIDQVTAGPHDTVRSADGNAELLIPQGALPAGKSAGDISIKPISAAATGVILDGQPPQVAYQMEPDGLQFSKPVLLSITQTASSGGNVPALFTLSGDQASPLTPAAADFDVSSGKLVAMAAIRHFSTIAMKVYYAVNVDLSAPGDQVVKVPFSIQATTVLKGDSPDLSRIVWQLAGEFSANGNLEPLPVNDPPFFTTMASSQYVASHVFTCVQKGGAELTYTATFDINELVTVKFRNLEQNAWVHTKEETYGSRYFQCNESKPTPTPTGAATPVDSVQQPAPKLYVSVDIGNGRDGRDTFGRALLSPQGDKSEVLLQVKMSPGAALPAFIQQGACPNPGASQYPLTTVLTGTSTTVVDASLASLLSGEYAINIQQSPSRPNVYIACGNIPKGVLITLGAARAGDPAPGMMALLSVAARTEFHVSMQPAAPGIQQSANIQEGSCANPGSVKYPLGTLTRGTLSGTINAGLADLLKGGYIINVQKSATEPGVSAACAALQ